MGACVPTFSRNADSDFGSNWLTVDIKSQLTSARRANYGTKVPLNGSSTTHWNPLGATATIVHALSRVVGQTKLTLL